MSPDPLSIKENPLTILDTIVAAKKLELEQQKKDIPLATLRQWCEAASAPAGFAEALSSEGVSLIAEVKKASPSRGLLRKHFNPVGLATTYVQVGASAISVLTDSHFQGELAHLSEVKRAARPGHPRCYARTLSLIPTKSISQGPQGPTPFC